MHSDIDIDLEKYGRRKNSKRPGSVFEAKKTV